MEQNKFSRRPNYQQHYKKIPFFKIQPKLNPPTENIAVVYKYNDPCDVMAHMEAT
jgi:hypothetical protein